MADRILDFDGTFFRGCKSDSDPGQVPMGYYWMGINMLNVGGVLSCRPGYRCLITLPFGHLQGATIFRPKTGLEQFVICVDGIVYVADWPFSSFRMLPNVRMASEAKQIYWCLTTQSAQRASTDENAAIEAIEPRSVLFMQDGGHTAPAWYDGSQSGHVRNYQWETPVGGPMAWVGDRLWVAASNRVYASDIANPFSFREQVYLGGVAAFIFAGEVTALATTPGLASPQLLVFTEQTCSLILANNRDRNKWPETEDMQREFLRIGCISQRSVVNHFGQLVWYSPAGIVFFDAAVLAQQQARMPIRDNEMHVSKMTLFDDLSLVAGGAYGQYLLMSVPAEDLYNKHTWVLNNASFVTLNDESGPSWAGFWLGTRPVEWVYGVIAGAERIFHVSTDEDGQNRLWECFLTNRLDNGCPITWAVFTRGYFGQSSEAERVKASDSIYRYSDLALVGIEEDLDIATFYAGGMRGAFKKVLERRIKVARGSLSDLNVNQFTKLYAYKAQSRILRTEDAHGQGMDKETGACPVERNLLEDRDDSFQLLIVGHGPATIRWLRSWAQPRPEPDSGDSDACSDETGVNAVRFDGTGAHEETVAETFSSLSSRELELYESDQSEVLSADGYSAVGVGHAESIVSQRAADRVAQVIATKAAEMILSRTRPPIYSVGE